jgi:hypothetical protein
VQYLCDNMCLLKHDHCDIITDCEPVKVLDFRTLRPIIDGVDTLLKDF